MEERKGGKRAFASISRSPTKKRKGKRKGVESVPQGGQEREKGGKNPAGVPSSLMPGGKKKGGGGDAIVRAGFTGGVCLRKIPHSSLQLSSRKRGKGGTILPFHIPFHFLCEKRQKKRGGRKGRENLI